MKNADQAEYWSGGAGESWVAMQELLDNQLASLGLATMDTLSFRSGERVVDIGCGAGQTTIQLASRVGAPYVLGADISRPLVARARERAPEIEFVEADAQTYDFGAGTRDAIFSRFGVMFFADPVAAFANLRRALRPGGRLAFLCWRPAAENPVMTVPITAAGAAGVPMPNVETDPHAPGPFAFADPDRVTSILASAGFDNIALAPHDERIGGNDPAATLALAMRIGPLGRLLREAPEHTERALDAVRAAIAPYVDGDGLVRMPSSTWIVTASSAAR